MRDDIAENPIVYFDGRGTACGPIGAQSTACPDSLATIVRDCVIVTVEPTVLQAPDQEAAGSLSIPLVPLPAQF